MPQIDPIIAQLNSKHNMEISYKGKNINICYYIGLYRENAIAIESERRRGPVVGHSLWTRPARVQSPWEARIIRCKNLALYIRDCESLCLSDETVKAVGPFYLVSMPGEVKDPTQGVNV